MVSDDFDFYIENPEQVERELRKAFPDEPGIAPLFAEIRDVQRFLQENYDPWDFPLLNRPSIRSATRILPWLLKLKKWSTFRYRERALRQIEHPGLRNWLTNVGYYRMPYLFFAGFWHLWAEDYWYPRGGMQHLHDRLAEGFRASGGELRLNSRVSSIDVDRGRATGVTLNTGEQISADSVVYAGDYKALVNQVLGPEYFPRRTVRTINASRLTEGLVSVYLGLDMSDDELAAALGHAHHPFYFPNYDVIFPDRTSPADVHRHMWVALNHFGMESPSAPPGKSTLTIQTFSSYEWENNWHSDGDHIPRTPAYRELKEKVAMELIELAENLVPGLRDRIEYMDVGTPLSLKRFTANTDGSSGGWCYDDQQSLVWRPMRGLNRIRTPLPNLFAAGHYALWPGGVISAALCGRVVSNLVLQRSPLYPLRRSRAT